MIGTRVVHGRQTFVGDPRELHFNVLAAMPSRIVPNLEKLLTPLGELGDAAEMLPVRFLEPVGVRDSQTFARHSLVPSRRGRATSSRA